MLSSLMNTLDRVLNKPRTSDEEAEQYTPEQLLSWAQGCMLEGLPDDFNEAYIECQQQQLPDGKREVKITYQFKLNADSAYETYTPADNLYPAQCIEMVLTGKDWKKARLTFNPKEATFSWE
ncbi:hypothetical protein [Xenorhabdus hominickii]|uniref:Uncharacterized protein n=1 Tax=Xenorhabdus hominickii TaxID=351679 RepID=A0A1V0M422_XENHO|nr:hypothetical protein [Xenorhabdus hominickii]ARD69600.1 hypothetical protein [Xenorhabdus hominickii]PHM52430.1 hypothetical protein Xhom_04508 [Xenorhabdus hominickii]